MEADLEKIISSFKEANQNLRKKAISIGVLMILTIGLTYMESKRLATVYNLIGYQYQLREINTLPDSSFQKVINGDKEKYFPTFSSRTNLDYIRLFEKVKFEKYNRALIEQEIDEADKTIEDLNKVESIGILGLNIPIEPVTYGGMIIILILFHDFTQIIMFRNQIQRKLKKFKIADWELGSESFGFFNRVETPAIKFLRFTSSIIAGT